ncbi:NADPH-dependent FMN reductase [Bradyrhizobium jicamae]|nr:NADPH-dependent FMN reductase [Bradyrhizobium jicamae]
MDPLMDHRPLVVGLGGTTRPGSSSERALRGCLAIAARLGVQTVLFGADALDLAHYGGANCMSNPKAERLIAALRRADAVVLSSPAYHGALSGLLKNALDYAEELRNDERPYLDGRAVGCIACAYGPQAIGTTLTSMRAIVHALRGWPTPLGVGINASQVIFDESGASSTPDVNDQLDALARQIVGFVKMQPVRTLRPLCAAE